MGARCARAGREGKMKPKQMGPKMNGNRLDVGKVEYAT